MKQLGLYEIAPLPGTDPGALTARLAELGDGTGVVQLTRVTSGFDAAIYRRPGPIPLYVWALTARIMTSIEYSFAENVGRLQESIKDVGIVVGLQTFIDETPSS
jgi:hypothetical protein